jgi:energy-coupling factor transporter ATP-binding protein EcfA2
MNLEPGVRIGKYELIRELGRGGMGQVFAARDTIVGRKVAIKFLIDANPQIAERFLAEVRLTGQFSHEHIVTLYEADTCGGMPYMVLEFLEGRSLRDVMGGADAGQGMAPSRVVELIVPIASALAVAHEAGLIHRDLKPENVFVTSTGQVKVLDFGIAKVVSERDLHRTGSPGPAVDEPIRHNLTHAGTLIGTLPYMSPEQIEARPEIGRPTDVWSLGVMTYEMLTGRLPIEAPSIEAQFAALISDEAMPRASAAVADVPDALDALLAEMLVKPSTQRPTAAEVTSRLEAMLPSRRGRALAEGESPYPGLVAFQEQDADRFFGRNHELARAVARVREHPIVGIIGPSGAGKSSLVRAGIGPALKASGERWEIMSLRPGRHPLAALAGALQRTTARSGDRSALPASEVDHLAVDELIDRVRAEPGLVGDRLRARARRNDGHVLLFVDQFEELYTLVADGDERRAFTAALSAVADDVGAPLRVVVSMRSDFLDRIAEDAQFTEELSRGFLLLQAPDAVSLREALTSPIELVGFRFESEGIVDDMIGALAGAPGALPLLQFAASKLWDSRDRARRLITAASYSAIGGISGALATHADDVIAGITSHRHKLTRAIFRRLVTPERTRAIVELVDLEQLGDPGEAGRIIELLVAARLLIVQTRGDGSGGTVELVHESLIERWPTLRRWLDEDQEDLAFLAQLAASARQWDVKRRDPGLLWRGEVIAEARRWNAQRPRNLPPRDRAFLDAGLALDRRGVRIRRALLTLGVIALAVVALGASVAAVWIRASKQQVERHRVEAEAAQRTAETARGQAVAEMTKAKDALAARDAADRARQVAEGEVTAANSTIERQNRDLKDSLAKVQQEKDKALAAQIAAENAAAEAKHQKTIADAANAKELARMRSELRAKDEVLSKLTTKLK